MSSFLDESSTFAQVLDAIRVSQFFLFRDVPERHQNGESASAWLSTTLSYGMGNPDFYYAEVPKKCRTDEFLKVAANLGCRVLKDTHREDTGIYRDLAMAAIGLSRLSLKDVSPAFRDEAMIEHVLKCFPGEIHSLMRHVDWLVEAMSDDQFDRCCQEDFMVALDAPAHRVKGCESQYLNLTKLSGHEIVYIRRQGRLDLISLKLKEDKWPFPLFGDNGESMPIEPESMEKLLVRLEKSDLNTPYETIYMACMMREPIDQVVPLMASNRLKKLLIEMYSREALAPFMKADAGLRGAMLEESLGL